MELLVKQIIQRNKITDQLEYLAILGSSTSPPGLALTLHCFVRIAIYSND
jgi:hypothetical protein